MSKDWKSKIDFGSKKYEESQHDHQILAKPTSD